MRTALEQFKELLGDLQETTPLVAVFGGFVSCAALVLLGLLFVVRRVYLKGFVFFFLVGRKGLFVVPRHGGSV